MKGPSSFFAAKMAMVASAAVVAALVIGGGCGPGGHYAVSPGGGAGGAGAAGTTGSGGTGQGLAGAPGTGGMIAETGGAGGPGSGGGATGGQTASGGAGGGAGAGPSAGGRAGGNPGSGGSGGTGGATGGAGGGTPGSGGLGAGGGTAPGGSPGSGGATSSGGGTGTGGGGGRGGSSGAGGSGASGGMGGGSGGAGGYHRILSVDFVGGQVNNVGGAGGKTVMPMPMALTEVAGLKPAANWNAAAGAVSPSGAGLTPLLLDNGSTAGSASLTWNASATATSPGVYSAGLTDEPGDVRMMNGYLDPAGGAQPAATITVTGLPTPFTTGSYDVYVYFLAALSAGQTRTHQLTLTTPSPGNYNMSVTVSQTGPTMPFSGYTLATATTGNYVLFKKVTGSQFTLTSTALTTNTMALRAPVNGLQIVWPSGF